MDWIGGLKEGAPGVRLLTCLCSGHLADGADPSETWGTGKASPAKVCYYVKFGTEPEMSPDSMKMADEASKFPNHPGELG